jgi:hypothetical protein
VRDLLARQHLAAALILFAVVLVELWPALIEGRLLSPTSLLYNVAPWHGYTPKSVSNYYNDLLVDVPASYYPWDFLARSLIHRGVFPAWNPYALAGTPFFANPQVAWFSPFSLPLWILPLNYAFGVAAALKLWMAGFGTYLLVRELRLGFWPGIVAGLSFMLCAFNVVWMAHGIQLNVGVMLPWIIWLTERVVRGGGKFAGLALVGASAVIFAGGHPGTQVHVVAAVGVYALVRSSTLRTLTVRVGWTRLAMVGVGIALGALLLAVTLLPAVRASAGTAGAAIRTHGASTFPGATMPVGIARTILFPDWWGRPSAADLGGPANYNERTLYAGTVAVLLAAVALLARGGWRRKAPFTVLAAIGLAAPLGVQPLHALLDNVPPFDTVQNQRMLLLFLFGIAVLAAFGVQAVIDERRATLRTWGVIAAGIVAAAIAVVSIDPAGRTLAQTISHFATGKEYGNASVVELTSVVWWSLLTLAVAIVLLFHEGSSRMARYAPVLLAVLAAVDMLHFAHGYQPMGPPAQAIPPRTPAVRYLEGHASEGRVAGLGGSLLNDWTTVYGLRDVRGHDGPQPSQLFYDLWRLLSPQQLPWQLFEISALDPPSMRLLDILGARYLVAGPGLAEQLSRVASALKLPRGQLSVVYNGPDATVATNAFAVPRAMVAQRVRLVEGERGILSSLLDSSFNPHTEVLLDHAAPDAAQLAANPPAGGTATVVHDANAEVGLRASLTRPGVVMLDDQMAPGWTVRVDGRPASPLSVDGVMRGVAVPAGTHSIIWSYSVPGLGLGLVLSGIGAAGVLVWALIGWIMLGRRPAGGLRGKSGNASLSSPAPMEAAAD